MSDFDQGPGRNIEFCLITTGLDIDPCHGCWSRDVNLHLKSVIEQRADIHTENRVVREVFDVNASSFLPGYSTTPRRVNQLLLGLVEHSNAWTEESLTQALNDTPFPQSLKPQDGELSIDFLQSVEDGLTLFKNEFVTVDIWVEQQTFYYSSCGPTILDGNPNDLWLVSDGNVVQLYIKDVFSWRPLSDFIEAQSPQGSLFIQGATPPNSTNSYWLDTTGLIVRKFSAAINSWLPVPATTSVQPTAPASPANGDIWIKPDKDTLSFFEYDAALGQFVSKNVSTSPVQDSATNSIFVGTTGSQNFDITCGEDALLGGPLTTGTGDLRVKKDSILIQTAVDCINFIGPDLEVTAGGAGEVDVEHLPITCLPEQTSAPSAVADAGKVFTLEVGGQTELFYIDNNSNITQLTNNGTTAQNIFLDFTTLSAVAGQTMFTLPGTATGVLSVKINGVDTTAFSFTAPTVTYFPGAGGYTVQVGDIITVLYYGT